MQVRAVRYYAGSGCCKSAVGSSELCLASAFMGNQETTCKSAKCEDIPNNSCKDAAYIFAVLTANRVKPVHQHVLWL